MMGLCGPMRRINIAAVFIAVILFIVPFFWLKPGYVDMGGDAGRLYFLDPIAVARNTYRSTGQTPSASYDIIPYELYLGVLKTFIPSPTNLIAFEHGIQISLAFLSIYFIVQELILLSKPHNDEYSLWIGIAAGLVYVGLMTKMSWTTSLPMLNQIFLNPLIFYLLLRYVLSFSFWYILAILLLTMLYSGNFGFSAMPQLLAFYPLAIGLLLFSTAKIFHRRIPWVGLCTAVLLFIGLHAFHIMPFAASLFTKGSFYNSYVFTDQSIQNAGVQYFNANHEALGKISTALFQPALWNQNIFILFIPMIMLLGFILRPSKLLGVVSICFAATFFLVSANITHIGVSLYRILFYIPGFMMFRSFSDKWYGAFAFFYSLLFAISFNEVSKIRSRWIVITLTIVVVGSTVYRLVPFLEGKGIGNVYYQSNNVSRVYKIDPNLLDAVSFVHDLPQQGKFLTLPLTFPYYQIAYGSQGGAYVGISLISEMAGKSDYAGFWSFGPYAQSIFDAIQSENITRILQILSTLNVRYVFYNSDTRIMDNFPDYPYIYPGFMYSSKDQLPAIRDQSAYKTFLAKLPLKKLHENGFYSIYEIDYPFAVPSMPKADPTMEAFTVVGRLLTYATLGFCIVLAAWLYVRRKA